jgi:glycosyltransferase involved in cell wall biosynthesis
MPPPLTALGVVRLELLTASDGALRSRSSIANWFAALGREVERLGLLVPVQRAASDSSGPALRLRAADSLFAVPDVAGYLRLLRAAPRLLRQLVRLRRVTRRVLCRVPEHGSFLLLPLVAVLGFQPTLWLVADREAIRRASLARRRGLRVRLGTVLGDLNARVEAHYLRRWPVIANGSELAARARSLAAGGRVLQVTSTALRQQDIAAAAGPGARQPGTPLRLLYVGRVAPDKGLDTLLAGFAAAARQLGPETLRLDLVGWAAHGERARLETELERLGLSHRVHFHGPQPYGDALFEWYRAADVFVLTSPSEGTPRALVEAIAFGLPVIATAVGGIPDVVSDGEHGCLVTPDAPADLAEAIVALATDAARRARMGRANHSRRMLFSVEALAARMAGFIAEQYP